MTDDQPRPSTADAVAAVADLGRPADPSGDAAIARRLDEIAGLIREARAERRGLAERIGAKLDALAALLRDRDYPV